MSMAMEMLSQMRFKELQAYAKANGVPARDVNMACERRELLGLIQHAQPATSSLIAQPDGLAVMEQLLELGNNPAATAAPTVPSPRRAPDLTHRRLAAQALPIPPLPAARCGLLRADPPATVGAKVRARSPLRRCPSPARKERIAIEKAIIAQAPPTARLDRSIPEISRAHRPPQPDRPSAAGDHKPLSSLPPTVRTERPAAPTRELQRASTAVQPGNLSGGTTDVLGFPVEDVLLASGRAPEPLSVDAWPMKAVTRSTILQLRKLCVSGVPHALRPQAWRRLVAEVPANGWAAAALKHEPLPTAEQLRSLIRNAAVAAADDDTVERDISKDIHRTFPANLRFARMNGPDTLSQLLRAYAHRCPEVGYCQGMNFVAATIVLVMVPSGTVAVPPKELDGCLAMMCFLVEALVPGYYSRNLAGVVTDIAVVRTLVQKRLPRLHEAFKRVGYDIMVILPRWLPTLLVNVLPTETVLRVWDVCLVHGRVVLLEVILALFHRAEDFVVALVERDCAESYIQSGEVLMSVDSVFKTTTKGCTDPEQLLREAREFGLTMEYVQQLSLVAAEQLSKEQAQNELKRFDRNLVHVTKFDADEVEQLRAKYSMLTDLKPEDETITGLGVDGLMAVLQSSSPRHCDMASEIHQAFDSNNDGVIDMKELVLGLSSLCKGTVRERLELGFKCWDTNDDGHLDKDEIKNMVWVLLKLHYKHPPAIETVHHMAHSVFSQLDTNRDLLIDLDEFVAGVVTMPIVMECFCSPPETQVQNDIQAVPQPIVETKQVWQSSTVDDLKDQLNNTVDQLGVGLKSLSSNISSFWK